MKKLLKSILFWDVIFLLIMFLISFILGIYNYQFLSWIKYLIIIICFIGIIIGTIQVLRKKKKLCFIICVLEFFIIIILSFLLVLYYSCNVEEIVIKDDIKMIYYGEDYNWIIIDDQNGKTAVKMLKEGAGIEAQTLSTGTLYMDNLWDKIKLAFMSKITTEKVNDIECYKICINDEWQLLINKQNLLLIREKNGSTDTGIIEYKINEVRDEDVLMPNLAGYTINDTTQQ